MSTVPKEVAYVKMGQQGEQAISGAPDKPKRKRRKSRSKPPHVIRLMTDKTLSPVKQKRQDEQARYQRKLIRWSEVMIQLRWLEKAVSDAADEGVLVDDAETEIHNVFKCIGAIHCHLVNCVPLK
jgi:hypothetical protein